MEMKNILDFDLEDLKVWMAQNNEKTFRAKQVFDYIYNNIFHFENMKNVPLSTRMKLSKSFYIELPKIIKVHSSEKSDTFKFLLKYQDNNIIEAVLMKYNYGNSICVSTQIGCRMGCSFCASTVGGLIRNLSAGEILAEILCVQNYIKERISNVVLMGSGEPFDNYENVIKFLKLVNEEYGLNIGHRHITVSTCGIVPKIIEFSKLNLQVTLAISLHASNDELRKNVMPIANKYSINEIMDACRTYINTTNKRITFEYALIKNVNDSSEKANELSKLLKGMLCHVNLIPVNEIEENNFNKTLEENISNFSTILNSYGIQNTVRKEMGTDINAACGQLRRSYIEKGCN